MTKPRCNQICLESTPYYHIVSRCVRRAFLCGVDQYSGESFEHRREWVTERLRILAEVYCIDVAAYAVMSNHYHLVLHIDQTTALKLTESEVIHRWKKIFNMPLLIQRKEKGEEITEAEQLAIDKIIRSWKKRLYDISWFMRCLNEPLARMANKEDNCTGHFWEGRYKSQALLDDAALLTCMSYVDLNPIRARMAYTPEASDYTSIQSRIRAQDKQQTRCHPIKLQKFIGDESMQKEEGIQFSLHDYLQLVDYTGRAILENKRGHISDKIPPILNRLGIKQNAWLNGVTTFEKRFQLAAGAVDKLQAMATQLQQKWLKGCGTARLLYKAAPT